MSKLGNKDPFILIKMSGEGNFSVNLGYTTFVKRDFGQFSNLNWTLSHILCESIPYSKVKILRNGSKAPIESGLNVPIYLLMLIIIQ